MGCEVFTRANGGDRRVNGRKKKKRKKERKKTPRVRLDQINNQHVYAT